MTVVGERRDVLERIGLNPKYIDTISEQLAQSIENVVDEAGMSQKGCAEPMGKMFVSVAANLPPTPFVLEHRKRLLAYITNGRIASNTQLAAAIDYFTKSTRFEVAEFERACGVGVVTSPAEIKAAVTDQVNASIELIREKRYTTPVGTLLGKIRSAIPFADVAAIRAELDAQMLALLGPKTEADLKPQRKPKQAPATAATTNVSEPAVSIADIEKQYVGRALGSAVNPPALLEEHNRKYGTGRRTRFPPEPNGFLHIGHAKAMNFSFRMATESPGGTCFLRYDDTNPSAEKAEYIESIGENVAWLGHKPTETTFSSEYFPELYRLAQELIRRGKAYVCHQTQDEIKAARAERMAQKPSPWRDTSPEENLQKFEWMRQGRYAEGEVSLRMKIDITSPNPCMWDPIAYRIIYEAHPHVGDRWCVYPSYDFTHCIVDSLEHITHSLCTLEFEVRRDSYYWLLEALDLYRPAVWEYSRLNITYNVLSKRKLKALVMDRHVNGWDDPRLLTINGLRRRGYSPTIINEFCTRIGVTRADNTINMSVLEAIARQELDDTCHRAMVVVDPLKVTLTNFDEPEEAITGPLHPKRPEFGTRSVLLSKVVYIERSDFRLQDAPGYYGLAPGKQVHLKFAYHMTCTRVIQDSNGRVVELECTLDKDSTAKVKGILHWVSGVSPVEADVRLYSTLFKSPNPSDKEDWLGDLNPLSLIVCRGALLDAGFAASVKAGARYQFERVGYFIADTDSTPQRLVFNRIVELKESKEKREL